MTARSLLTRMQEARARAFVGRELELELFEQALATEPPPFSVLWIHGPGGVGKTTLLERLEERTRAHDVPWLRIDGAATGPVASRVLEALGVTSLAELRDGPPRRVIAIDGCEVLAPLDRWIREALIPALPEGARLVLAGRSAPSPPWRIDAGLAALTRIRALRNLSATESAALLASRGLSAAAATAAHALTFGHPLGLVLVGELARERSLEGSEASEASTVLPALGPDVVTVLVQRFLDGLPTASQRAALEMAAHARVVTEGLLRDLGSDDPARDFAWLRDLSFVRATPEGLMLHDLLRDAVVAELSHRDPGRARALGGRVVERNARAFAGSSGAARHAVFLDRLDELRRDPVLAAFYDWEVSGGGVRALAASEIEPLLAEVEAHEGPESAAAARYWWSHQPSAFVALLDGTGEYVGSTVLLDHTSFSDADRRADPAMAALDGVLAQAPPRPGERVTVLRFWIWRDGYQAPRSVAHAPHSMVVGLTWLAAERLSWSTLIVQRVEVWRPFLTQLGFTERPEVAFRLANRAFSIFARDFRAQPWGRAGSALPRSSAAPIAVLSQDDFAAAVREALRSCARPDALDQSPLLRAKLLRDWAEDEAPTGAMLRELLEAATSSLADTRDDRPQRCVELTFLRAEATQELAAERLGLSFSTYRRQLARGIEGVIAYLWQRELRS